MPLVDPSAAILQAIEEHQDRLTDPAQRPHGFSLRSIFAFKHVVQLSQVLCGLSSRGEHVQAEGDLLLIECRARQDEQSPILQGCEVPDANIFPEFDEEQLAL